MSFIEEIQNFIIVIKRHRSNSEGGFTPNRILGCLNIVPFITNKRTFRDVNIAPFQSGNVNPIGAIKGNL